MKKIFFIRHGETFSNTGESYDHPAHIRLTDKGHAQAKGLVKKVKNPKKIIVSKYFRTLQTAEHVINKNKHVDVLVFPEIHEFTYLSNDKFIKHTGDKKEIINKYWETLDPRYNDGDNAESFLDFSKRINETVKRLKEIKSDGDVYVFTHANFTRGLLIQLIEFPKLHASASSLKKDIKKMMQRFHEASKNNEYHVNNCDIVEVTSLIKKR